MKTKRDVLADVTFGHRVAEDELQVLGYYFVQTEQCQQLIRGDVDVVYGPKGSGKSALYAYLFHATNANPNVGSRTIRIGVTDPKDDPIFNDSRLPSEATESDFRHLWKLYFLVLLAAYIRELASTDDKLHSATQDVLGAIVEAKLLPETKATGWKAAWIASLRYLTQTKPVLGVEVKPDPITGVPSLVGKLSFSEPTVEQRSAGHISVDSALRTLTKSLEPFGINVWIGIDRLDAAFCDDRQMETKALRSLFRVYLDFKIYSNLKLKIFLRDDIWRQLSEAGGSFREASHIVRTTTLTWDKNSLLNLVIRRALQSQSVRELYDVNDSVLGDLNKQKRLFNQLFPERITQGTRQVETLDWMLRRIEDASARACPRELLHLIQSAREKQMRAYEQGVTSSEQRELITEPSLWAAIPEVSEFRFTNTFCAEHPGLAVHVKKLMGKRALQTAESLAIVFDKSPEESIEIAERLVEAGFFSKRTSKKPPAYTIPLLYRDALRIRSR